MYELFAWYLEFLKIPLAVFLLRPKGCLVIFTFFFGVFAWGLFDDGTIGLFKFLLLFCLLLFLIRAIVVVSDLPDN